MGIAGRPASRPEVDRTRSGLFDECCRYGELAVPKAVTATVIHGLADEVIPLAAVLRLVERSPSARLLLVHDDHPLAASGELIRATVGRAAAGQDPIAGLCHMGSPTSASSE